MRNDGNGIVKIGMAIGAVASGLIGASLYVNKQRGQTTGYFKCARCGEYFTPGFKDFIRGVHVFQIRYLECPHCGEKSWCKKVA